MKILIVDDESPARDRLRHLLAENSDWNIVGEAANGRDALAAVEQLEPELVLLDIRMPGMDGIEAARHLATLAEPPAVIFTTAYNEYAVEAFEANAVGYVLKPVRRQRLVDALERATRPTRPQLAALSSSDPGHAARRHIGARVRGELRLIPIAEIFAFQADQKYVTVMHEDGEVLIDESLKELEQEFTEDFVRVHRSTLLAIAHIDALTKTTGGQSVARIRNSETSFPVSRRLASAVAQRLKGQKKGSV